MHENNEKQENYASEVFRYVVSRLFTLAVMLIIVIAIGFVIFFANDNKWRETFNSFSFISQDGIINESEE